MVFNGEVYNFQELKSSLEKEGVAPPWRGHSDTEIMLACFAAWGVEASLKRFNGMFAFALWDKQDKTLTFARDRLGKKPLYYGWCKDVFLFGSELKSFWVHPAWDAPIDDNSLAQYLQFGYIPGPRSIFKGIYKLPPGSWLRLTGDDVANARISEPSLYWDHASAAADNIRNPSKLSREENLQRVEDVLTDAVKIRMISDVPLGAFLSGGVDSSLITALMQKGASTPVRTFSIGFDDKGFNEAEHAKAVAGHLGTDHTEFYVSPQDALNLIPTLPHIYDEPFSDSSQVPTYMVCALAKKHVTVVLTGDGGDEFFYGYRKYLWAKNLLKSIGRLPGPLRKAVAASLRASSAAAKGLPAGLNFLGANRMYQVSRLQTVGRLLGYSAPFDMHRTLMSLWDNPADIVQNPVSQTPSLLDRFSSSEFADLGIDNLFMLADASLFLVDDCLVKVDRASMAASLETRCPLLDYRVVETAWSIPFSQKFHKDIPKSILKDILYRYVPRPLIDRPKRGFSVPIKAWLGGPLRQWASDLLSPTRLSQDGLLRAEPAQQLLRDQIEARQDHHARLWTLLMFQAWYDHYRSLRKS